jgi:N-acetylglucosamine-6-sulfatase
VLSAAAGAVTLAALALPVGAAERDATPQAQARPNIILIVTDDQTAASFNQRVMPETWHLVAEHGTLFSDFVITTPTCCPSRASMLTGQYAHNHGVLANRLNYAGLTQKKDVLPAWLSAAGYRTAHVGKYLNGYFKAARTPTTPGPGWGRWDTLHGYRYYNYDLASDGRLTSFGDRPADYLTRRLNQRAQDDVRRFARGDKPFYLQLDQFAPHQTSADTPACPKGPLPDPEDESAFSRRSLPHPPSFNEEDVSDKRTFLRKKPMLSRATIRVMTARYRCRLASLQAVDRGVARLWDLVRRKGEASNTALIFVSDNGFFAGEHRISAGKTLPYAPSLRVPFAMRAPNGLVPGGAVGSVNELAANVDIAPTILDLANAQPCRPEGCRRMDGRSLIPLLDGAEWPAARSVVVEYGVGNSRDRHAGACQFSGIRETDRVFVRYNEFGDCLNKDEAELYNLDKDPFELDNLADDPAATAERTELRNELDRLRDCSGIEGRDPPPPSGLHYCE